MTIGDHDGLFSCPGSPRRLANLAVQVALNLSLSSPHNLFVCIDFGNPLKKKLHNLSIDAARSPWHLAASYFSLAGASSTAAGSNRPKSGSVVFTPSFGTSSFADQTIAFMINIRRSSTCQFL